jgi:hypothetical protein
MVDSFSKSRVKSQTLKMRGKITIRKQSRGKNTIAWISAGYDYYAS